MNENKQPARSVTITRRSICVVLIIISLVSAYVTTVQAQATTRKSVEVFVNGGTTIDYSIGVNTSSGNTSLITKQADNSIRMEYPPGQSWGAVFITYGPAAARNSVNLSQYPNVSITVKGETGTESLNVGIKDVTQPDGSETTIPLSGLTTQWKTYEYKLSQFTRADATKLYVVFEFVFSGSKTQTVYFNNITYYSDPIPTYTITVTQTPNGNITPGTTTVINGSTPTFTITPNQGYHIATITVNGAPLNVSSPTGQTYQFPPVTTAKIITATFDINPVVTATPPIVTASPPIVTATPPIVTATPPIVTTSPLTTDLLPEATQTQTTPTNTPAQTNSTPSPTIPESSTTLALTMITATAAIVAVTIRKRRTR